MKRLAFNFNIGKEPERGYYLMQTYLYNFEGMGAVEISK